MIPFQAFLLVLLAALLLLYLRRLRTGLGDRVLALLGGGVLAVFFLRPEWATAVANFFGIGRGVDLMFYLGHALMAFLVLMLHARWTEQQDQIVQLSRELARLTARPRPEAAPPPPDRADAGPGGEPGAG